MIHMLGEVVGNYKITGKIGEGGMGAVYLAQHQLIGHEVAVKVLLPAFSQKEELVARFFNEAKAATAIKHPAIVEIYDFGYHVDHSAYIVMERLEGESLESRIRRHQRLPAEQAINVTRQVASALSAAHDAGIVHRDLKPDNIFIVPDPDMPGGERAKILDFGIAKLAADERKGSYKTRTGSLMGTPAYMAPEQCRGAGDVDSRADLYSLGCMLFEMLCGRTPFIGDGIGEVLAAHIHVAAPSPRSFNPGVDPQVEAVVGQLMVKDPAQRLGDARQLMAVLDQLSGGALRTGDTGQIVAPHGTGQVRAQTPPPGYYDGMPTPSPGGYDATVMPPPSGFVGVPTPPPFGQVGSQPVVTTMGAAAGAVERSATTPPTSKLGRLWIPIVIALLLGAAGAAVAVLKKGGDSEQASAAMPADAAADPEMSSPPSAPTVTPIAEPVKEGQPATTTSDVPAAKTVEPAAEPAEPAREVKVSIKTRPRGAKVLRMPAGKEIGKTPFEDELPATDGDLVFLVRKRGYRDERVTLPGDKGGKKRLKLVRGVADNAADTPPAVAATPPTKPAPTAAEPTKVEPPAVPRAKKAGAKGGACYGNGTCNKRLKCDKARNKCFVVRGKLGSACYPNGTCDKGLSCNRDRNQCVSAGSRGSESGPCYPNRTCNQGLKCYSGTCKRYQ